MLLIVFSAFSASDKPPRYNYLYSFKKIRCNKLFVLDNFGPNGKGNYYLGQNRSFIIEHAVIDLIGHILKRNNINKNNVIICGSSKGGFAALYFGIKYGFGHIIAGAPQTLLGNYLKERKPYLLEYISGGTGKDDVDFINSLLFKAIDKDKPFPKIYMHVGKYEHHYEEHVLPFIKFLRKNNIDFRLDLGSYNNHSDVGQYFIPFAIKQINEII